MRMLRRPSFCCSAGWCSKSNSSNVRLSSGREVWHACRTACHTRLHAVPVCDQVKLALGRLMRASGAGLTGDGSRVPRGLRAASTRREAQLTGRWHWLRGCAREACGMILRQGGCASLAGSYGKAIAGQCPVESPRAPRRSMAEARQMPASPGSHVKGLRRSPVGLTRRSLAPRSPHRRSLVCMRGTSGTRRDAHQATKRLHMSQDFAPQAEPPRIAESLLRDVRATLVGRHRTSSCMHAPALSGERQRGRRPSCYTAVGWHAVQYLPCSGPTTQEAWSFWYPRLVPAPTSPLQSRRGPDRNNQLRRGLPCPVDYAHGRLPHLAPRARCAPHAPCACCRPRQSSCWGPRRRPAPRRGRHSRAHPRPAPLAR